MADPFFAVPEVRKAKDIKFDEYGEGWIMLDGIETKVPSIVAAKELLARQDATRVQIRADLDAQGLREGPDGTFDDEGNWIAPPPGSVPTRVLVQFGDEPTDRNLAIAEIKDRIDAREEAARNSKPEKLSAKLKRKLKRLFRKRAR